jgi:hypothetical protein
MGSRVFVCDNLAFHADHVIRRKHTANAKRDLPGLVSEVIEPLHLARKEQAEKIERYKALALPDPLADQAIMAMYRLGVINLTRIANVLTAYEEPPHDWGDKTPWRMFNAATFALAGKVAENPTTTQVLTDRKPRLASCFRGVAWRDEARANRYGRNTEWRVSSISEGWLHLDTPAL